ncbi:MAG TPA: hypothetical protein VHO03_08040 [Ignavibacteriales bacterium]|nr:hypothetical protein [Ignavibacteriales bacterium]
MTIPDNSHMCPYCHDKIYNGWIDSISLIIAIPVCIVFAVIGYLIGDSFEELGFFRHFVAGGGVVVGLFVGAIVSGIIGGIYGEKKFTAKTRRKSESSIINTVQQSSPTEVKVEDNISSKLKTIEDLKINGLITNEEYHEKRKSILEQI